MRARGLRLHVSSGIGLAVFKNLKNGHEQARAATREGCCIGRSKCSKIGDSKKSLVPWQREGSGVKGRVNRKGPRRSASAGTAGA